MVKAPQFLAPMGQDQGLYHTVAEEILRGAVPYRDAWDPKPPGVFYTHAALLAVIADPWRPCHFGALPGLRQSDVQPRCGTLLFEVVDFVYSLLVAGLVAWLARRLGYSHTGAAIAFGLTATFVNLARMDPEGSTPEKYALVPAVAVVLVGLMAVDSRQRRWLVLAGVLGASAALFKLPDLASFGAISVVLVSLRRARDLLWMWGALVIVLTSIWALFALMGAGGPFLEATLRYNLFRVGFQSERVPFAAVVATWQMFRDGLALLWLPALLGVVVTWRTERWRVVLVWAAFDVLALFLGGTKFTREYFVQLVPSFSLLASAALESMWINQMRGWIGRAWLLLSLSVIGVLSSSFQAGFTLRVWNEYVTNGWTTNSVERLGTMVASLPPDEALFVWGNEAQLYPLSGRLPVVRFLNTAGLEATGDQSASARRAELMSVLRHQPPAVIVVDAHTADDDPDGRLQLNVRFVPELQQLLTEQYRQMDSSVLRPYIGGDREQVFIRQGGPDLCARMPTCRLS